MMTLTFGQGPRFPHNRASVRAVFYGKQPRDWVGSYGTRGRISQRMQDIECQRTGILGPLLLSFVSLSSLKSKYRSRELLSRE
jgi:hypothetical protein